MRTFKALEDVEWAKKNSSMSHRLFLIQQIVTHSVFRINCTTIQLKKPSLKLYQLQVIPPLNNGNEICHWDNIIRMPQMELVCNKS
jgi:hypothetical protein